MSNVQSLKILLKNVIVIAMALGNEKSLTITYDYYNCANAKQASEIFVSLFEFLTCHLI